MDRNNRIINIHLPIDLIESARKKADKNYFPSFSEYVRQLIRRDLERLK